MYKNSSEILNIKGGAIAKSMGNISCTILNQKVERTYTMLRIVCILGYIHKNYSRKIIPNDGNRAKIDNSFCFLMFKYYCFITGKQNIPKALFYERHYPLFVYLSTRLSNFDYLKSYKIYIVRMSIVFTIKKMFRLTE